MKRFLFLCSLFACLVLQAQPVDIRRGGGGSTVNTNTLIATNAYDTNQFVYDTLLHIKSGAIVTNISAADGSFSTPAFAFKDDPNTGIYRSTTDTLAVSAGGTGVLLVAPSIITAGVYINAFDGINIVAGGITNANWTANRLLYNDANGKAESSVTLIGAANNIGIAVAAGVATNVIDVAKASSTNILNGALTILHATNGVANQEWTHVRWFWAGGADRALTIPTAWKTNVNSAVPVNITNGTITKMYVTTIGDTSSSANQSNVFVSFEYYK